MRYWWEVSGQMPHSLPAPVAVLPLALAAMAVYSNSLGASFVFDDFENIERMSTARMDRIDLYHLLGAAHGRLPARPGAILSFALNYCLNGYSVFGYHLVNLLIHAANGVLLLIPLPSRLNVVHDFTISRSWFDPATTLPGLWTCRRNAVWADEVRLFSDCVQQSPDQARTHYGLSGARRLIRMVGEDQPPALDALAAAYAETGRFEAAAKAASQARHLAESFQVTGLAEQIGRREALYRTGWPCRKGRMP